MMTGDEGDVQVRRASINGAIGGFALLVLGTCLLSTAAHAAGPSGPTQFPELRALLASGEALSESAMAHQTGTGLHPPSIISNDQGGGPRVQLWDELRIVLPAPAANAMTAGGQPR